VTVRVTVTVWGTHGDAVADSNAETDVDLGLGAAATPCMIARLATRMVEVNFMVVERLEGEKTE